MILQNNNLNDEKKEQQTQVSELQDQSIYDVFSLILVEGTFIQSLISCDNCLNLDKICLLISTNDKYNLLCPHCSYILQLLIKEFLHTSQEVVSDKLAINFLKKDENGNPNISLTIDRNDYVLTKRQLEIVYSDLNENNKYLYDNGMLVLHDADDSIILNKWRKHNKNNPNFININTLTVPHKALYLAKSKTNLHLRAYSLHHHRPISINRNALNRIPPIRFYTYCCLNNPKNIETNSTNITILNLLTNRTDGFAFTFSPDDLYSFVYILRKFYKCKDSVDLKSRSFSIDKLTEGEVQTSNGYCFFCGNQSSQLYKINIFNRSYIADSKCIEQLAYAVICSSTYRELFESEYIQFKAIVEKQRKKANREKEEKRKKIEQAKLDAEKRKFAFELKKYEKSNGLKKAESNRALLKFFSDKVLNCQNSSKSVMNLGYPKRKAKTYPFSSFKKIYIEGIDCKTLQTPWKKQSDTIIYLDRPKDKLCLSLSFSDLKDLIIGLKQVRESNSNYYNEKKNFYIYWLAKFDETESCYFCGDNKGPKIHLILGNYTISFCESCKNKIIKNFENILNNKKSSTM